METTTDYLGFVHSGAIAAIPRAVAEKRSTGVRRIRIEWGDELSLYLSPEQAIDLAGSLKSAAIAVIQDRAEAT